MTFKSTASLLAALFLLLAAPGGARAGETAKTVAVADFSVRAPAARAGQSAWLGPAVAELLQAKMQLFRGARVLERMRLALPRQGGSADAAAGEGPGAMPDDVLQITPAAVLIFGSVEVSPGDDEPARIKVQARSVQTETAAVITDAAFSGTAELAGLLQIAESLAKSLADGLGFTYTPEQLTYAEPAAIDALKLHLEGDAHAAAGRHREAIDAYQRALDNNGGKYYPAAHRAQGEAYRALAGSLGADEARRTREEYLAKFKADALVASGALFDLGLAYEANGLWREAIGAYDDYLTAIGTEGETVRWTYSPGEGASGRRPTIPAAGVAEGGRFHLLTVQGIPATTRWIILDLSTGAVVGDRPLFAQLGIPAEDAAIARFFGSAPGRAYLYTVAVTGEVPRRRYTNATAAAVGPDGSVFWKTVIGGDGLEVIAATATAGRLFFLLGGRGGTAWVLVVVDGTTGAIVRHIGRDAEARAYGDGDYFRIGGIDADNALFFTRLGVFDLTTGTFAAHEVKQMPTHAERAAGDLIPHFTGLPGVTGLRWRGDLHLFRDGGEILVVRDADFLLSQPPVPPGGWIVFEKNRGRGLIAVNPDDWSTLDLYGETRLDSSFLGQDEEHLFFVLKNDPARGSIDPRFGVASTEPGVVLNVVSKRTRSLVGKHFLKSPDWLALAGGNPVVSTGGTVSGLALAPERARPVVPAAEAHLGAARCAAEIRDDVLADGRLTRFEAEFPSDPRAALLRLKMAVRSNDRDGAARLALRALASGGLGARDLRQCLDAVRAVHPEVRDALLTPVKARLLFRSMADTEKLVCTVRGPGLGKLHVTVDTATKRSVVVPTPEFPGYRDGRTIRYFGDSLYFLADSTIRGTREIHGVNLLTGKRIGGGLLPGTTGEFVRGLPTAVTTGDGSRNVLLNLDPETLRERSRIELGNLSGRPHVGDGVLIFTPWDETSWDGAPFVAQGQASFLIVDRPSGTEIARPSVALHRERIAAVSADDSRLLLGINGVSVPPGERFTAASSLRLISLPIRPGAAAWTFEAEGLVVGNIVLEEGRLTFPAFLGRLPPLQVIAPEVDPEVDGRPRKRKGQRYLGGFRERWYIDDAVLPLSFVSLDRKTGALLGADPLPVNPWDPSFWGSLSFRSVGDLADPRRIGQLFTPLAPRIIFPGVRESRHADRSGPACYWPAVPGRIPLKVTQDSVDGGYYIVIGDFESAADPQPRDDEVALLQLAAGETVYESIGGGTILVKDFAAGRGLERVVNDPLWIRQ